MQVFRSLEAYLPAESTILTIGTFDGLHLGHVEILKRLNDLKAHIPGAQSAVLTFDPHPRAVLTPDLEVSLLHTLDEKIEMLEQLDIDRLLIVPFTLAFSHMTSSEFIESVLVHQIHVSQLVVGYDHRFGRNRTGSFEELYAASARYHFKVEEIPAQQIDDSNVSSTKIRHALNIGDVRLAARFLGYRYQLRAEVIQGEHRGRDLGFPTANLHLSDPRKLIPLTGVYAVAVEHKDKYLPAMMNIGYRPTFGDGGLSIEVHIIDFENDLYGETIHLEFIERIRPERKFSSAEELVKQLKFDREAALQIFSKEFAEI